MYEQKQPQYQVGTLYNPGKTTWEQGADFNYRKVENGSDGMLELRLFYHRLTEVEVSAVSDGQAVFSIVVLRGVLFFLYRFGESAIEGDCSVNWHMTPVRDRAEFPRLGDANYGRLFIILVDADTGITRTFRLIRLGDTFARGIYHEMDEQKRRQFHKARYLEAVDQVYEKFSNADELFKVASRTCIINPRISMN
jgi:hypothetical protein